MRRSEIVDFANSLNGESGHNLVLSIYNSQKNLPRGYVVKKSDAWCATFVSAVFINKGYNSISECSCSKMIDKARKLGIWQENDAYIPKLGDIILYDWNDNGIGDNKGEADHVGIVIKVDGNNITIREGNKSNSIGNRELKINGKYIRGYIIPPFETETPKDIHRYKTIEELVDGIIRGDFGVGVDRKNRLYDYLQDLVNDKLSK